METNSYEQLLSSQYNPVEVALLPDNSGFSFLDNGLIKVKNFLKRSPKTIEIYEPLYAISSVQWLNATTCFFHAKQGNRYGIYQVDLDGQLETIIKSPSYDYLYPQKIDDTLFFIARDLSGYCYVKKTNYYATQTPAHIHVQNFAQNSLMNLIMINEREGFVIEHVSSSNALLTFNFYQLYCNENVWNKKIVFTFSVPIFLFFDKSTMLRDPMQALFPRVASDKIYFISSHEDACHMKHYYYDLTTDEIISCDTYCYFPVPKDTSCIPVMGNYQHILMSMITQNGLLTGFSWE